MNIDFYNPVRICSGENCFRDFRGFAEFGKRCMIVCGRSGARKCGALADAEAALADCGIAYTVFDRVEPNPMLATVFEGGRLAREFGAEFIVAIGGGSPMDAGKAVAAFAANPQLTEAEMIYTAERSPALPVLAVNTTAGTGSEVTSVAVLTVPSMKNKKSINTPDLFPRIAFCDPRYTYTLPRSFTMSTAVDALCHAVEGYFMKKANPVSDGLAEEAIRMLQKGIRAVIAGNVTEAVQEELMYGSTLAGLVISRTGTGFVHSTGYMLTYHHDIPHGWANAYFLPDFVDCMAAAAPERVQHVYELCGVADKAGLEALVGGCDEMKLDLKLTEELCCRYADKTIGVKNVKNAVAVIDRDQLLQILRRRFL